MAGNGANMHVDGGNRSAGGASQVKLSLFKKVIKCEELSRIEKSFLKGALIIGLGGFVLGYDISVVAGGIENLNEDFHFDTYESSLVVSVLSLGGVIGSVFAGPLSDSVGRWKICQLQALLFVLGSFLIATANHFALFILGRLIVGVGTAFAFVGSLSYLNEISPMKYSGRFQGAFELFGAFGMFIATVVNICAINNDYATKKHTSWRFAFGITVFIGICQSILLFLLPESPSFLVQKGKFDKAREALEAIYVDPDIVNAELESLKLENMTKVDGRFETFIKAFKLYSPSLYVILGLVICQSLSGGIVFASYGPYIFSRLGFGVNTGLLATLALGALRIIFTIFSIFRIDSRSWGRKQLLSYGIATMFIGYLGFILSWFFCMNHENNAVSFWPFFLSLSVVVCGNSVGYGAVTKVLQSEMFPTLIKSRGLSISLFVQSFMQFIILFTFPVTMHHIRQDTYIFGFYGVFTLIGFVYVSLLVPETMSLQPNQILDSIRKTTDSIACCGNSDKKSSSNQNINQSSTLRLPLNKFAVDYDNSYDGRSFRDSSIDSSTGTYHPPAGFEIEIGGNPLRHNSIYQHAINNSKLPSDNDDFIS